MGPRLVNLRSTSWAIVSVPTRPANMRMLERSGSQTHSGRFMCMSHDTGTRRMWKTRDAVTPTNQTLR